MKVSNQKLSLSGNVFAADETVESGGSPESDCWSHYAISVKEMGGTATSWTVTLQVSLDGSYWTDLTTHVRATEGDGKVKHVIDKPAIFVRAYCTAVVLNTATHLAVKIVAV